jgi:hypothetical protein
LVQLRLIKPSLERRFPGLNICFGCKDDKVAFLKESALTISRLKVDRHNFAHIREIKFNGQTHPIEDLLCEAGMKIPVITTEIRPRENDRCVLVAHGNYPTKSLEKIQIEQLKALVQNDGYVIDWDGPVSNASIVVGVESIQLFEAAAMGVRTILVPTGLGTNLYQSLFPKGEIWNGTRLYKRG